MKKLIKPNTFLIGVQKSATTSVYDWISQHPEVCGPMAIKDYPFFLEDELYEKGPEILQKAFIDSDYNENNKIVLKGNVQYIFHDKALKRIHDFNNDSKLIVVLRKPVDRAISAYHFFKKLNKEHLKLEDALNAEDERLKGDIRTVNDLTYKSHGLYAKQLKNVYLYFDPKQVLVLFYDDVMNDPESLIKKTYQFLGIDHDFVPQFKELNVTGKFKHPWIHNVFFKENKVRQFFTQNILHVFLPEHKRANIRHKIRDWNTNKNNTASNDPYIAEKKYLQSYYKEEIAELEQLLNLDLSHWKE